VYKILDNLATFGIPQQYLEMSYNDAEIGYIDDFRIVDVRMLKDESNPVKDYMLNIIRATSWLEAGEKVVVCCSVGISRSNAIALGVLVKYFKMDFYDAWELVKEKVPICNIEPIHIKRLKQLFKVTLP
jgi:predicted protein tyrosine phosphatase